MPHVTVKIFVEDSSLIPLYATSGASGADLKAAEDGVLKPGEYKAVKTGVKLEIPEGYEAQIRPRSGLAAKYGVTILNSPGTIDSDYRGEIAVIMINHGKDVFAFKKGDRIAQMVVAKFEACKFEPADSLSGTERGAGGFGHTGI